MSKIYKFYQYPRGVNKGGILNTDISPTITHSNWECNCFFIEIDMAEQQDNGQVIQDYRIRKLTPTECFRLMDVDDTDILVVGACKEVSFTERKTLWKSKNPVWLQS